VKRERARSSPDFSDLTPVEPIQLDDPNIGAREYARRAANHALAAHRGIGKLAAAIVTVETDIRQDIAALREDLTPLLDERRSGRKWRRRALNIALGIATIVGGAGLVHLLGWGGVP